MRLSDPVTAIRGVGEKTAELMRKLGIETVEELLHAYPRNYDRYEPPVRIEKINSDALRDFSEAERQEFERYLRRMYRNLTGMPLD